MKEKRNFKKAYEALPVKLRKPLRMEIVKEAFFVNNLNSFYSKMNGKEAMTDIEWNKAKLIFADYGIDIETGQVIDFEKVNEKGKLLTQKEEVCQESMQE